MSRSPQERRPRRFFSPEALESPGQTLCLSKEESRHLQEVIRLEKGDKCLLIDGAGRSAEARVSDRTSQGLIALVVEKMNPQNQSSPMLKLRLYPALLQKGKTDILVEKAQELAVDEIIPLETKHTVLKMEEHAKIKVLLRWNKIAQAAAKQSGVSRLVKIASPQKFEKAAADVPANERAVLFHPSEKARPFGAWVRELSSGETLHLFLGPEGGFSEAEAAAFMGAAGKRDMVELGETLLRADTAFIGIVSALRFLFP